MCCKTTECVKCDVKDKKIKSLQSVVDFHEGEAKRWRDLWNEQRGGKTFDEMQKRYADELAANIELRKK